MEGGSRAERGNGCCVARPKPRCAPPPCARPVAVTPALGCRMASHPTLHAVHMQLQMHTLLSVTGDRTKNSCVRYAATRTAGSITAAAQAHRALAVRREGPGNNRGEARLHALTFD